MKLSTLLPYKAFPWLDQVSRVLPKAAA